MSGERTGAKVFLALLATDVRVLIAMRAALRRVLAAHEGNLSAVARALGISEPRYVRIAMETIGAWPWFVGQSQQGDAPSGVEEAVRRLSEAIEDLPPRKAVIIEPLFSRLCAELVKAKALPGGSPG
ncbi:MAG: hypothetical protein ACTHU0_21890 [Kofleriaceae bacterium]